MSRKRRHQSEKHQENINITDENAFEDISGEEQTEEEVPDEYEEAEDEQDDTVKNTGDEDIRSRKKVKRRRRGARKGVKKQAKKSMGKKPWIIAGSIIGALVVIYLGIAAFFMSHFLVNTSINGKDFSGKTVADVEEYLKEQVADYELTILEQNNVSDVITGSEISLAYKENSRVQDALENQRQLLWLISLFSESDTDITIEVEYDEAALEGKIQNLQAVTAEMPAYTSDSPEVQAACDEMNKYLKASITYPMDEDVVVDKDLISKWVTYDDDMKVAFNEDAVREWMREFGKKYDTLGTTRTITTPTGKTAEVSGGTYGWSVDEETETKNLINSIKNGEVAERAPAYKQTAASHGAQDWGSTYIEVDIAAQHMWYIVDGAVGMESDVVTGLPADGRDTPTGVYSILYTERDSTLKGETDPETGKPSYETPVAFWMPFTWQGHGFHDATWQSSFGGSRYQTNGSHGCVNMPYDKAEQLFNMISAGTPVIVHN